MLKGRRKGLKLLVIRRLGALRPFLTDDVCFLRGHQGLVLMWEVACNA